MTAYVVIDLDVTDPQGFQEYRDQARALLKKYGARNVLTDGNPLMLEGEGAPRTLVVHEFPSMEAVRQFWDSPEYQPLKELRRRHARVRVVVGEAA